LVEDTINTAEIAQRIRKTADLAGKSEEKLKLGIIDILSDYFREIVIDKARYEKTVSSSPYVNVWRWQHPRRIGIPRDSGVFMAFYTLLSQQRLGARLTTALFRASSVSTMQR
jgi:hypothetical protein